MAHVCQWLMCVNALIPNVGGSGGVLQWGLGQLERRSMIAIKAGRYRDI